MAKTKKKFDFGGNYKEKLLKKAEKENAPQGNVYETDERFYIPKGEGKDGKGKVNVLLRFLPFYYEAKNEKDDDIIGFTTTKRHFVKNFKTNKTLVCECPRTYSKDEKCPICEEYGNQYSVINGLPDGHEKKEMLKLRAKNFRATEKYVYNVYIIDDPVEPENNGQVKMMEVGFHVHKAIMKAIDTNIDKDEDEVSGDVFDLEKGYNFRYKREIEDNRNSYKSSKFINKECPLTDDEEELERIWNIINGANNLHTYREEFKKKFLSYAEIEKRYKNLFGEKMTKIEEEDDEEEDFEDEKETNVKNDKVKKYDEDDDEVFEEEEEEKPKKSKSKKDDDDDDLDFDDDDIFD